jgi:hypothetical protein
MSVAVRRLLRALAFLLLATIASAGTPGTFRGILGEVADRQPGWMYVRGHNDTLRVVYVRQAAIYYDDNIPPSRRHRIPARALTPGTEVRVTAEQDDSGDWRATEIEILKLGPRRH